MGKTRGKDGLRGGREKSKIHDHISEGEEGEEQSEDLGRTSIDSEG